MTTHNRAVLLVMLVLTVGMFVGMTTMELGGSGGPGGAVETTVDEKRAYVHDHYGGRQDAESDVGHSPVYVRDEGGNVLSKDALLASLRYQRDVVDDEAVATETSAFGVANLVASRAAGDPDASLDEQLDALASTDEGRVEQLVRSTVADSERASLLLPDSYDPESATAESRQMVFTFETGDGQPPSDAQAVLYEEASGRDDPEHFTVGEAATNEATATQMENTLFLVVPIVLGSILVVAAVTYRDPVDVVVGVVGVLASIVWMFGAVGWLGIDAGPSLVIGPVLVAGLSIDYGFHVFMRYREQRGADESIRPPMRRAVRSLALALGLVTVTASIGFLSNAFNPVPVLRELGVGITLGVVSAFVVFVTLVPALKVSVDGLLERAGLDRRREPLGTGAYLRPVLRATVTLARRGAPVVLVVALVVAGSGVVTWSALDRETTSSPDGDVADWKRNLPEPMGWEEIALFERQSYVVEEFRAAAPDDADRVQILVEGDVTADGTLSAVRGGIDEGVRSGAFAEQRVDTVRSPVTVVRSVADENDAFAATVADADEDGDGVPDTDLEAVYDHLYEVAPDRAALVVERTDGEYRSLRVVGPPQAADSGTPGGDRAEALADVSERIEADGDGLTATTLSDATSEQAAIDAITDGIVRVMLLALVAVFVALVAIYRWVYDSATLGAITAGPIAAVLGFVIFGMYLFDVPLTFLTALLVSLVIGIGVDYNIHLSDRFVQELERGRSPADALETAVVGTGGALLGSMLTSVAAFAGLLTHPNPAFLNFASLVVLAVVGSFLTSLLVVPSLLSVWFRHADLAERGVAGHDGRDSAASSD